MCISFALSVIDRAVFIVMHKGFSTHQYLLQYYRSGRLLAIREVPPALRNGRLLLVTDCEAEQEKFSKKLNFRPGAGMTVDSLQLSSILGISVEDASRPAERTKPTSSSET